MLLTRIRVCSITSGGGHATHGLVAVMKSDNFALRFDRNCTGERNHPCRRRWTECCAKDHYQWLVQTGKKKWIKLMVHNCDVSEINFMFSKICDSTDLSVVTRSLVETLHSDLFN